MSKVREHSLIPWTAHCNLPRNHIRQSPSCCIIADDDTLVTKVRGCTHNPRRAKANMEFIVRACNGYEKLKGTLRTCEDDRDEYKDSWEVAVACNNELLAACKALVASEDIDDVNKARDAAHYAVAKAESSRE